MLLQKLELKNFKGIKSYTLNCNGASVVVKGDNATGKTSIFDAVNWLLFGKDSLDRTDFGIKTLDENGDEIPRIDHSVKAVFEHNNKTIKLERIYKEVWSTKRGSATEKLSSHTTDFIVNGVPMSATEYNEFIEHKIMPSEVFKLITNPLYFNNIMKWQDRRSLLFELVGGDVDLPEDKAQKFEMLKEKMGDASEEQFRAMINRDKKAVKKELGDIPGRIDEMHRMLPDEMPNAKEIEVALNKIKDDLAAKEQERSVIQSDSSNAEHLKAVKMAKSEYLLCKNDEEAKYNLNKRELMNKRQLIGSQLDSFREEVARNKQALPLIEQRVNAIGEEIKGLRAKFKEEAARVFALPKNDEVCPTCHQALPIEQIEEMRVKALGDFNEQKVATLESINREGKSLSTKLEIELKNLEDVETKIKSLELRCADKLKELDDVPSLKPYSPSAELVALKGKIESLEQAAPGDVTEEKLHDINLEIESLKQAEKNCIAQQAILQHAQGCQARIDELNARHQELGRRLAELEQNEFEFEEYIRVKVGSLEQAINERFKYARFKLFETQMNGGIKECCEVMMDNIPFKYLNHAAQVNIGIDVINTLTKHYKANAPVFIDNAEAVTEFIPCNSQMVFLEVSSTNKKLRMTTVK